MLVQPTNERVFIGVLHGLEDNKSCDHDGISNEILKCCSSILEPLLVKIFNQCTTVSIFPECYKVAKVSPLYKKGDKTDPHNYKPSRQLIALSKIFEKKLFIQE